MQKDYDLPPKEGFVLTHFLTVKDVKASENFIFECLEEISLWKVNPLLSKLLTAG